MGAPDAFITSRRPSLPSTPSSSSARAACTSWPAAEAEGAAFLVNDDPEAQADHGLECSAAPCSKWQQARRSAAMACAALALAATALLAVHIALNQGPHTVLHQALRSVLHRRAGAAVEAPAAAIGSAPLGVVSGGLMRQQLGDEAAAPQGSAQPARTNAGGAWGTGDGLHFGAGVSEDLAFEETTAHPSHQDADDDDSESNSERSSTTPGDADEGLLWSEVTGTEAGSLATQPPLDGLMWSGSDVLSPSQEDHRLSDFDRTFELTLPSNSFLGNVPAQYFVYDVSVVADDPRVAPYLGQVALALADGMRFSAYSQAAVHLELDTTALPAAAAKAAMYLDAMSLGAPSKLPANSVACLMYGWMGLPGTHGEDDAAELRSKAGEDAVSLPDSTQASQASRGGLTRGQCAEVSAAGADYSDDMASVVSAEVPPSAFVRLEDGNGRVRLVLDMLIAVLTTTATDGATGTLPADGSALNN